MRTTADLHIRATRTLSAPDDILAEAPLSAAAAETVATTRDRIRDLLSGRDQRLLVIVGPCSIHDVEAARSYAQHLLPVRDELAGELEIVMRVYFEKPRTTVGWKGLINDPHLDGSGDINHGLRLARRLLLDLAEQGMPAATEVLDPIIPQYLADLVSWAAIGARTTESQTHREMASGLSMPVGFKNGTDGGLDVAVNAMLSARTPHHFLGIDRAGRASIVLTSGNADVHAVLRGGKLGPNYHTTAVTVAAEELARRELCPRVLVDCSHDNAGKDHTRQPTVCADLAHQVVTGSRHILGVMIESHLVAGRQDVPVDRSTMIRGQSITDACVDLDTTVKMLRDLAVAVRAGRARHP